MGSSDVPPPGAPAWLVPASTVALGSGIAGWLACYVLMMRRSAETKATPVPLLALGINLGWEVVYAFYVTEMPVELAGFILWLAFDLGVVRATLRTARHSFASSPLLARHAGSLLVLSFLAGVVGNGVFAWWWLLEAHRGCGDKTGKTWKGLEARDTTELAWWSAGVAQVPLSVGFIAMVLSRGHSGGQSYGIWLCRFFGTLMGLPVTCGLLWWYWPEAHEFVFHPLSFIMIGTSVICDLAYPFLLAHVKSTERVLPDGMVVAGDGPADLARAVEDKKK